MQKHYRTMKGIIIMENAMKSITDGIIGFAIGDALGVPAEFKSREHR